MFRVGVFGGFDCGPQGRGPSAAGLDVASDSAQAAQLLQREVDAFPAYMAVEEGADLTFGQAFRSGVEGFADAPGGGIDGGNVEEEAGAGLAVVPHGQGGVEMGGFHDGAAIEGGVNGAEAENLGFGAAGGCAVDVGRPWLKAG